MPVYEYECPEHGVFDSFNTIAERDFCACPVCGINCNHVYVTAPAMKMNDHDWSGENNGKGRRIGQLEESPAKPRYFQNRGQVVEECKKKGFAYDLG